MTPREGVGRDRCEIRRGPYADRQRNPRCNGEIGHEGACWFDPVDDGLRGVQALRGQACGRLPMTNPRPDPTREAAEKLWQWCWTRTININLPTEIRKELPDYAELRVYTMPEAPYELPAVCHIERALRAAAETARREALEDAETALHKLWASASSPWRNERQESIDAIRALAAYPADPAKAE